MTIKRLVALAALITIIQVRKVYCNFDDIPRAVAAIQGTLLRTKENSTTYNIAIINFAGVAGLIRQDARLLVIQIIQTQPRLQRTGAPQKEWEVESVPLLYRQIAEQLTARGDCGAQRRPSHPRQGKRGCAPHQHSHRRIPPLLEGQTRQINQGRGGIRAVLAGSIL